MAYRLVTKDVVQDAPGLLIVSRRQGAVLINEHRLTHEQARQLASILLAWGRSTAPVQAAEFAEPTAGED